MPRWKLQRGFLCTVNRLFADVEQKIKTNNRVRINAVVIILKVVKNENVGGGSVAELLAIANAGQWCLHGSGYDTTGEVTIGIEFQQLGAGVLKFGVYQELVDNPELAEYLYSDAFRA